MKTNIEIKDKVFDILNVSDITDSINGTLYNGKRPAGNDVDEDITIVALSVDSEFVQSATITVNFYAKDTMEGVPNYGRFKEIFPKIYDRLVNYSSTEYLKINIDSQLIEEAQVKGWSLLSIRTNCQVLKS